MASRSEFWVHIHQLAQDLEREGIDNEERLANLGEGFFGMPHLAQAEVEKALAQVYSQLPDLVAAIGLRQTRADESNITQ
jgi:hypothetical protein